jgi:hypothetical protein
MQLLGFVGLILETCCVAPCNRIAGASHRWWHIEQTGLDAAPIVALLTFLVGAVVAFSAPRCWPTSARRFHRGPGGVSPSCANSPCC